MKAKRFLFKRIFSLEKSYERAFKSLGLNVSLFHVYRIKKSNLEKSIWKFLNLFCFTF